MRFPDIEGRKNGRLNISIPWQLDAISSSYGMDGGVVLFMCWNETSLGCTTLSQMKAATTPGYCCSLVTAHCLATVSEDMGCNMAEFCESGHIRSCVNPSGIRCLLFILINPS